MEKFPPLVFSIVENMVEIFAIRKILVGKGVCTQKEIDEEYEEILKACARILSNQFKKNFVKECGTLRICDARTSPSSQFVLKK